MFIDFSIKERIGIMTLKTLKQLKIVQGNDKDGNWYFINALTGVKLVLKKENQIKARLIEETISILDVKTDIEEDGLDISIYSDGQKRKDKLFKMFITEYIKNEQIFNGIITE